MSGAALDLIVSDVRLADHGPRLEIGIAGGQVAEIAAKISAEAPRHDGEGCLAFAGFVEPHIHLDKADILERCPLVEGSLREAIALTAAAKAGFSVADVKRRAMGVTEQATLQGIVRLRSFVEVDPRAGMRSLEALIEVRRDMAYGLDIALCAFAQEGLTQEMQTFEMLDEALKQGADLVGGCPYTDPDPVAHVGLIFDLGEKHGVDVDFHADFDLDPRNAILPEIARQTKARGFGGRVSVGHGTKLAAMALAEVDRLGGMLAEAGVAVTALPATDLFLMGREADRMVPRGVAPLMRLAALGVTVSLGNNNILNPFTPYGDVSLLRMANLFANVAQLARDEELAAAFEMVSGGAARQLRASHGIRVGAPADIVLIEAESRADAVRRLAPIRCGFKRGRMSFSRGRAELFRPA